MIFVFGSNLRGIHGAGAAAWAAKHKGAKYGVGVGRTGDSYALPTKGYRIEEMSLDAIQTSVDIFLSYAKDHPDLKFQVTQVGCGLAGHKSEDIAPMFKAAPSNCLFDMAWKPYLNENAQFWGTK